MKYLTLATDGVAASVLECQGFGSNLGHEKIWFKISAPSAPNNQLSCNEYPDCTLSVGRSDGKAEDWPPVLILQWLRK